VNLRRIAAVASKEWRETVRDRMFLALAFLIPILWMLVFGYGMVLDVEHIPYAVLDRDQSALSRDYLYRFQQSRYFDFKGGLQNEREADGLLAASKIRAAIIVPERFQERLTAGMPVGVQTLVDGTFPLRSDIAKGYIIAINAAFGQELVTAYLARAKGISTDRAQHATQPIKLEVRYLYNQEVKSAWTIAPALVMFVLTLAPPLLTALGIVREKERGSIYNIYSSTVSRLEFLVGKLAPYVGISAFNILVLWIMAVHLFGAPFKGNGLFFYVTALLFVFITTGQGLIVSLLVSTQQAAAVITVVLSIVPTILYGGLLVPVSALGPETKVVAHLFPAMYFTNIVHGTFLKGVGLDVLWQDVLILAVYATTLLSIGYWLFRKRPAL
jgi:ABC-2 type transport system permease protein/ribosome-dependent ATPase